MITMYTSEKKILFAKKFICFRFLEFNTDKRLSKSYSGKQCWKKTPKSLTCGGIELFLEGRPLPL